jgi:CheY-like chemotaxis protein
MTEKVRILIVDDDEKALKTLSDILRKKGFYTETAKTGKEALTKAEERFFNVALIDIKLPDMTGIELLQTLTGKHLPTMTIMMTAYATLQNAVTAINLGASAYIMKPIDQETLDRTIKECLQKQEIFTFRSEIPASLRRPEIRSMLHAIKEEKITEFKPLFSYEKGMFYPEVEQIFLHPSTYYSLLEELEKYGIVKKEFFDTYAVCPSCDSHKISLKLRCPSCESADIDKVTKIEHLPCGNIDIYERFARGKKLICPKCGKELKDLNADYRKIEMLFECHDCGKVIEPKHVYTCGDCGKNHTENQLNLKKMPKFIITHTQRTLIDKWLKDFNNIMESARELYREPLSPYDPNRPKRYAEDKAKE